MRPIQGVVDFTESAQAGAEANRSAADTISVDCGGPHFDEYSLVVNYSETVAYNRWHGRDRGNTTFRKPMLWVVHPRKR